MSAATMPSLPNDLPIVERKAVRLVVQDCDGRILLLQACDATAPEHGVWWELPGGGIDPNESYLEAAARELREETGIVVELADVGPPCWRRTSTFQYRRTRRVQFELVVKIELDERAPAISNAEQLEYEKEECIDYRWWSITEMMDGKARFYPGRLADILPTFLAGHQVDEPFEFWS